MPRQENLTVIKGGLNRQRTKGAALKDSLYDLLNGYVTTEKTVRVRPGTIQEENLTAGTFGLTHFGGEFHVFASTSVAVPAGYQLHILRAPTGNSLSRIHFAEPFLGALYVAAEFDTDEIYHYWLNIPNVWEAHKVYEFHELVSPSVNNGFVYKAERLGNPNPIWTPDTPRAVDDQVEPTIPNGLYFRAVSTFGSKPISGPTEPEWDNAEPGQQFIDTPDGISNPPRPTPNTPPRERPPLETRDRYGRQGGRTGNDFDIAEN